MRARLRTPARLRAVTGTLSVVLIIASAGEVLAGALPCRVTNARTDER